MRDLIHHIGRIPLLRRTVDSFDPDKTVVLLFNCNLESAIEYYTLKYQNPPEFRLLDWDGEFDLGHDFPSGIVIRSAYKQHEFMHKEWCVYAPPHEWPFASPHSYYSSWEYTVLAANRFNLRSLLCDKYTVNGFAWLKSLLSFSAAYFEQNVHAFAKLYHLFADEESRSVFASILRANLTEDYGYIPLASYPPYFHPQVRAEEGDTVCEAGACYGDTSVDFATAVGPQGKAYCFEPITVNYAEAQKHTSKFSNLTLENCGLWCEPAVLPMSLSGHGQIMAEGSEGAVQTASFVTLDDYLAARNERCDFLKMDIENAELPALKGAEKTIRTYRPKMAICVYHSLEQFMEIPKYIQALDLDYEFFLGHHAPFWFETVLYCRPRADVK